MDDTAARTGAAPDERLLAILRQLVRETHPGRAYPVTLQSSFERDLALDSLARVELMLRVGKAFGSELPAEALSEADNASALLRLLGQQPAARMSENAATPAGARMSDLPVHAQTLLDVLDWHADQQPDQLHVRLLHDGEQEEVLSYRALRDGAQAIATGLAARGFNPRETAALMLPTGRDYLVSFFGVLMAGGIPVPIYPPVRLSALEDHLQRHAGILRNAGTTRIITVDKAKPVAVMLRAAVPTLAAIVTPAELATHAHRDAAPYRPHAQDLAFLQYTSGSTGDPKGVMLTHANLLANIRALGQALQATPDDVFVSWLPLYHDMGLIGAWFGSLYHGMPLVLMSPLAFLARPALWLQAITRHRGTMSAAPNFAYELCVRHVTDDTLRELDLSSWRAALNGAEPVSPATLQSFAERFAPCGFRREALMPVYGLAECSVGLALPPPGRGPRIDIIERDAFSRQSTAVPAAAADAISIPCCGRPLPGHEIRIVDEAGDECPERRVGRLEFRGPSATAGYYRNREATARLLRNGWLDSGDYAYLAAGEVHVTGRVKDMIKRGGRNLYPYELEQAVGNLRGIRKGCVAAFARIDRASGSERLVIVAETRVPDDAARDVLRRAIDQTCIDVTGARADDIVLAPPHAVPKTSSGKIRRLACRDLLERGEIGQHDAAPWRQTLHLMQSSIAARATLAARRASVYAYGCYAWTIFAALAVPAGTLILLSRPPLRRRIAHVAAHGCCRMLAIRFSATGLDRLPQRPHVLLVNHASYFDAILLTAMLSPAPGYAFVAKRALRGLPGMGRLLDALGTVFVERADAVHSTENVEQMTRALKRGESLLVFPEGTLRREAGLRPFHAGAFVAASRVHAPIIVAGLRGARHLLRESTWLPRRSAIEFEVGPALLPHGADWAAAAELGERARNAMLPLCGEFDVTV